jgi:hypothetical protein
MNTGVEKWLNRPILLSTKALRWCLFFFLRLCYEKRGGGLMMDKKVILIPMFHAEVGRCKIAALPQ